MVEDFVITSEEGCYAKRIYMFVKDLIQDQSSPAKIEILLNYLSFDIFCSWYETESANENGKECAECLEAFIDFANNYTYFANNSVFFLEIVFADLIDPECIGLEKKMEVIKSYHGTMTGQVLNTFLNFQNNFSVALGNFFSDKLRQDFRQIIEKMKEEMSEEATIVQKFETQFGHEIKANYENRMEELLSIEFCKIYCLDYLDNLLDGKNKLP